MPLSTTLEALHEVIQMTMGWTFSHLWEFDIDGRCYGDPSFREFDDEPPIYKAKGLRLGVVIARGVDRFAQRIRAISSSDLIDRAISVVAVPST